MNNIGIHDIETYFPKLFVSQEKLEKHNNIPKGKYTNGLMQNNMSVPDDTEDIVSMCLTALNSLLIKSQLDTKDIGRLSVGTETIVDKSKSIKTILLDHFNFDNNVIGVDYINACYGGTAAILDSINWIESSRWDGRYAVVITGDIAIYDKGPARPTGGAGVTAILIGPDAPIVFDTTISSYFEHAYDFYKPNLNSEYPVVDGKLSNECYLRALDYCYHDFHIKDGRSITSFDYSIFHAPYGKLVKKSYERLLNKEDEVLSTKEKEMLFDKKVKPTLKLSSECGNMYTSSIYAALYSLLTSEENIAGKNVSVFSYGSGLTSSLFNLNFIDEPDKFQKWKSRNVKEKLNNRIEITPDEFDLKLERRENKTILNNSFINSYKPQVFNNTFTLNNIDKLKRRSYNISNTQKRYIATKIIRNFKKIIR